MHFSGDVRKNSVFKISEDCQKNVFEKVVFKQFQLSNLSTITIVTPSQMYLVSVPRIFVLWNFLLQK